MAGDESLDYPAIVERIREAVGGGSDQIVAEKLGYSSRQTILNMKKGEGLTLSKLAEIARTYDKSPLWLIFGSDVVTLRGRAIAATDAEIISKFELDELSALGELTRRSGIDAASTIHILTLESLTARGMLRQPPEIPIDHLEPSVAEEDLARIVLKGEILDKGETKIYRNVRTVNIPKRFKPTEDKDDWVHPDTFHAYIIKTDDFAQEGIFKDDLVLCAAAYFYMLIEDGQPVMIPVEKGRVAFARFYRDVFSPRFIFRPIKDRRPILKITGVKWADLFKIQGIIRPAPA